MKNIKGYNIKIINKYLSRDEVLDLIDNCDCYVSFHRSEGLGLTLLEAMAFEKPVLTTAYSGNLEFTDINNSYLVKYKLTNIKKDCGPYKKGCYWADVEINDAIIKMKAIFNNKKEAKKIGLKGKRFLKNYSKKNRRLLYERLKFIKKREVTN